MNTPCILATLLLAAGTASAQAPAIPANERTGPDTASERHPEVADPIENVKRALRETDLPANAIVISRHAQALVLTGQVDSKADAARAASTAQAAAGDLRVINELKVGPEEQPVPVPPASATEVQ